MPPKTPAKVPTERPYGLSDVELMVSLHVLKLLAQNTDSKVDKTQLAKLTGHEKPDSAFRIWFNAKKKMDATHANGSASAPAKATTNTPGATDDPDTPTVKPTGKKRGRTSKKAVAAAEDAVEDAVEDASESPSKRAKMDEEEEVGI